MYGPTETTIWSTVSPIDAAGEPITIGRPIANTQVYIVDRHSQQNPIGMAGELLIGGDGVVRGYLDRPELTAERFVELPAADGARVYRTGDLVTLLAGRRARVPRPPRPPGEDPRLPHRAGRDRGRARPVPERPRDRRRGPHRHAGRAAPRRLRRRRRRRRPRTEAWGAGLGRDLRRRRRRATRRSTSPAGTTATPASRSRPSRCASGSTAPSSASSRCRHGGCSRSAAAPACCCSASLPRCERYVGVDLAQHALDRIAASLAEAPAHQRRAPPWRRPRGALARRRALRHDRRQLGQPVLPRRRVPRRRGCGRPRPARARRLAVPR